MPKTPVLDATALRMLEGMVGLDLTTKHGVSDETKALLAEQLGATVIQQLGLASTGNELAVATGLTDRVTDPRFGTFMTTAGRANGCATPIRLSGTSTLANAVTGEVLSHFDTADLPNGVLYKACGNRREAACPACSRVYKYDTYQLIKAGMAGGKGVPESVANHPALFVTLTAPSFGPVHTRVQKKKDGPVLACRPHFRDKPVCPHGRPLYCAAKHSLNDRRVGTPMCVDCYQHESHVVWNHFAPDLWQRTTMAWKRAMDKEAKRHGTMLKVRYAKVAEFQARGTVHIHALLRLDGYDPAQPEQVLLPPECITAAQFRDLIAGAIKGAYFTTPIHPDTGTSWQLKWGKQVDVRIVRTGMPGTDAVTETHVAGYLAKYATKSTEATGVTLRRFTAATVDYFADPDGNHVARLVDAAWTLGRPDARRNNTGELVPGPFEGLRRGAHQYGFAGHFSTKSQRYSTTLGRLRVARRNAAVRGTNPATATPIDLSDDADEAATVTLAEWTYQGSGWLTLADAALAMQSAAAARARKPAGLTQP